MTRSILVTGASTGIGRDAAETFCARGWQVFAACRQPKDVAAVPDGATGVHLDYEDTASIERAVAQVFEATGGTLDVLFNNGAYGIPGPLEDLSRDAMSAIFNANFLGWHDLTVRLIPAMRKQGHGRIVNCSSVLGLVSPPFRGAYNATKFAVEAWSDALRLELEGAGIKVVLIEPGPIRTPFRENAVKQFEKWVDWETSARVEEYRDHLLKRLYGGSGDSRFELEASAVTDRLVDAATLHRPKPRYFVTTPTYLMDIARRLLPTRALDAVLRRA